MPNNGSSTPAAGRDILIKGGRIIDPASGVDAVTDLLLSGGVVAAVGADAATASGTSGTSDGGKDPSGADPLVIDASGLIVSPGFIDLHTHLREPGRDDEEDIESASRAALLGGFTTITAMPNTQPVADDRTVIAYIRSRAAELGLCRVEAAGAITRGLEGRELTDFTALRSTGAIALSDDGRGVQDAGIMRRALQRAKVDGLPLLLHEEDESLGIGGHMHEGDVSFRLGLKGVPALSEEVMVARDLLLAAAIDGARIHLQHLSSTGAVVLVKVARTRRVAVTCEVTPHHLFFCDEDIDSSERPFDTDLKVNPPIRSRADREALIDAVLNGTIDAVATDHAPHAAFKKAEVFDAAPCGAIGLQTALGATLTVLGSRCDKAEAAARAVKLLSTSPARILGLDAAGSAKRGQPARGTLSVGSAADVTVFDAETQRVFELGDIVSRSKNSPFVGRELTGGAVHVIVGGELKVHDSTITDSKESST